MALVATVMAAPVWGGNPGGKQSPAVGVSQDWWSRVQHDIQDSEYHIGWQDETKLEDVSEAWHAPNRAHDFRIYFTETGIRVIPRTEEEPSWEWGLSLIGYGRGDQVGPVAEATLSPDENRIEYDRSDIVEW